MALTANPSISSRVRREATTVVTPVCWGTTPLPWACHTTTMVGVVVTPTLARHTIDHPHLLHPARGVTPHFQTTDSKIIIEEAWVEDKASHLGQDTMSSIQPSCLREQVATLTQETPPHPHSLDKGTLSIKAMLVTVLSPGTPLGVV